MARKPTEKPVTPRSNKTVTPKHNTTLIPKESQWTVGDKKITQRAIKGGLYSRTIEQNGESKTRYGFYEGNKFRDYAKLSTAHAKLTESGFEVVSNRERIRRELAALRNASVTTTTQSAPSGATKKTTLVTDEKGITTVKTSVKSAQGKNVADKLLSEPLKTGRIVTPNRSVLPVANSSKFPEVAESNVSVNKTIAENARKIMKDPSSTPRQKDFAKRQLYAAERNIQIQKGLDLHQNAANVRKAAYASKDYYIKPTYAKTGTKWDPNSESAIHLRPGQYVSKSGYVRSTSVEKAEKIKYGRLRKKPKAMSESALRAAERKYIGEPAWGSKKEIVRQQRAAKRAASAKKRAASKLAAYREKQAKKARRDARRNRLLGAFAVRDAKVALTAKPQLVSQYLKSRNLSQVERKAIKTSVPHALRYPAMRHASGRPLMAPPTISGALYAEQWRGLAGVEPISPALPGRMFTTPQVLNAPPKFIDPRGVMFNVDISDVQQRFMETYPEAIRGAMREMRPIIAKKLLDIIEPYVPKDTGALYTSAEDLTTAGAEGGISEISSRGDVGDNIMGATIAYRQPYAEIVYFDLGGHKRHGAEYNAHHGTSEKGEKETSRWIEAAFQNEQDQIDGVMKEMAGYFRASMNKYAKERGYKRFRVVTGITRGENVGKIPIFMARG